MDHLWKIGRLCGNALREHWRLLMVAVSVAAIVLTVGVRLPAAVRVTLFVVTSLLFVAIVVFAAVRCKAKPATDAEPAAPKPDAFVMLSAHGRVSEAEIALFSQQYYFPVVHGRDVVGVLSKAALSQALAGGDGDRLIVELMVQTDDVASGTVFARAEETP